jgi:hypothetical protein
VGPAEEDFSKDVLTFRRWPAGITGIPRLREWDAVVLVELPELEASPLNEFELSAPVGGEALARADEPLPRRMLERVADALDTEVDRPYDALVVRKDRRRWSAGARAIRLGDAIELPAGFPASSLEVVRTPAGALETRVDGAEIDPALAPLVVDVVAALDRRGRQRFESFVARADKVGEGLWQLIIDPL